MRLCPQDGRTEQGGPLVSSNKRSGIQRRDDRAEQGRIGSRSSLPWRARGSQSLCRIWVQLGSNNASCGFLATPKMAVNAVGFQSVTVRGRLDTVEVRSSSLLVPTIPFNGLAANSRKTSTHNPTHNFIELLLTACRGPSGTPLARPVFHRCLPACRDRGSFESSNGAGCPAPFSPGPWRCSPERC